MPSIEIDTGGVRHRRPVRLGTNDDLVADIERIRRGERMTQESAVEGPYSHKQWVYIHLRHAELHLSFLGMEAG